MTRDPGRSDAPLIPTLISPNSLLPACFRTRVLQLRGQLPRQGLELAWRVVVALRGFRGVAGKGTNSEQQRVEQKEKGLDMGNTWKQRSLLVAIPSFPMVSDLHAFLKWASTVLLLQQIPEAPHASDQDWITLL